MAILKGFRGLTTLAVLGQLCWGSFAEAKTVKVGPTRTQKTPTTALMATLQPGDVVEIDGNHTYPSFTIRAVGTQASPITIRGIRVAGKRPVIQSAGGWTLHVDLGRHLVIEGLEITGGDYCYRHHGADVVLRDVEIHHCRNGVLGTDGDSGSLTMEYCEIHHNGQGTQHHQIYMATDENAHPGAVFRLQHSYIHSGAGGNNVKSRAERNEIYGNWIEGAVYHELELIGPDQSPWDPHGVILPREDSDVVGNVLHTTKTSTWCTVRVGGDGTGGTAGRYRFVNNTFVVLPSTGAIFRHFMKLESIEMHNNVIYAAGGAVKVAIQQGFDQQGDEQQADPFTWSTGVRLIAGSNNWISTGMIEVPAQWTNTLTGTNPGFTNVATLDLRPTATSPLLNAGLMTTFSPAGHAFPNPLPLPTHMPPLHTLQAPGTATARAVHGGVVDIGAFERSSGVVPTPDSGPPPTPDSGPPPTPDSGPPPTPDSGPPPTPDSGPPPTPDSGPPPTPDSGPPPADSASPKPDTAAPDSAAPDSATPVPDAGPSQDSGPADAASDSQATTLDGSTQTTSALRLDGGCNVADTSRDAGLGALFALSLLLMVLLRRRAQGVTETRRR